MPQDWYQKNRQTEIEKSKRRRIEYRNALRTMFRSEKEKAGCKICGEKDYRCLDFHHVRGEKSFVLGLAKGRGYGLNRVRAEIAKCDVLCANCHRKEHQEYAPFTDGEVN